MKRTNRKPARQRLLEAATRVFARDGLTGSTTRAIAREARVNEVTLFRQFGTKDKLLAEVVDRVLPVRAPEPAAIPCTEDLAADITAYIDLYASRLHDNLALVRTLIGETHHQHVRHEREVFRCLFRPLKEALVARLEQARASGQIRRTISTEIVADHLKGMIFTDVLRRSAPHARPDYTAHDSFAAAVELFLHGVERAAERR